MIIYKAECHSGPKISKIEGELDGETEYFLRLKMWNGDILSVRKQSGCVGHFHSFDEAKQFLMDIYDKRIKAARRELELQKSYFGDTKGMKEAK
jgi:hypothetical protein